MSIELIDNSLVIELFSEVYVFKDFEAEGGRARFEPKVDVGKLSLGIPNYVTVYSYN